jgi:hypothetical protein
VNDATVGETGMAYYGVCMVGIESRREHRNDSSSVVFNSEGQIVETIPVISQKPTFVEEGAVPRLRR